MKAVMFFMLLSTISFQITAVEPSQTEEEARWTLYFGPVTDAEKQVFPDWRAERRKQIALFKAGTYANIYERYIDDPQWYSRRMQEWADGKPYVEPVIITAPEPSNPHTPEAKELIEKIKKTYASISNYHEKVKIWVFDPQDHTQRWQNNRVVTGEYWFSRAWGLRKQQTEYREWSQASAMLSKTKKCLRSLTEEAFLRKQPSYVYSDGCGTDAYFNGVPLAVTDSVHQEISSQTLNLLNSESSVLNAFEDYGCRVYSAKFVFIVCENSQSGNHARRVTLQVDPRTFHIVGARWDRPQLAVIEYIEVDSESEIGADALQFSIAADASAALAKAQKKRDAEMRKLSRQRTRSTKHNLGDFVSATAGGLMWSGVLGFDADPSNERKMRSCDFEAIYQNNGYYLAKTDPLTRKPWQQIFENCRYKYGNALLFIHPPAFTPCPNYSTACGDQLQQVQP